MKNKSTTIILVILIIGLIGSGIAFYVMEKEKSEDATTTTVTSETAESETESTTVDDSTMLIPSEDYTKSNENETQDINTDPSKDYIAKTGEISITEAFDALYSHYGNDYEVNCVDKNTNTPLFRIVNLNNGELYASVRVDLYTSIATETIEGTNQVNEFSLLG